MFVDIVPRMFWGNREVHYTTVESRRWVSPSTSMTRGLPLTVDASVNMHQPLARVAIPKAHQIHGAHQLRVPASTQWSVGVVEKGAITQHSGTCGCRTMPCV